VCARVRVRGPHIYAHVRRSVGCARGCACASALFSPGSVPALLAIDTEGAVGTSEACTCSWQAPLPRAPLRRVCSWVCCECVGGCASIRACVQPLQGSTHRSNVSTTEHTHNNHTHKHLTTRKVQGGLWHVWNYFLKTSGSREACAKCFRFDPRNKSAAGGCRCRDLLGVSSKQNQGLVALPAKWFPW